MPDVKFSLQADVLKWDNLSAKDMLENLKLAKIRANNRFNIILFISFNIILCPQHLHICTYLTLSTYNYQWLAVCVLSHGRRIANVDQIIGCDGQVQSFKVLFMI